MERSNIFSASTPRRHHLPAIINDSAIAHCQSSPISMRYSVPSAKTMPLSAGETISHNSGNDADLRTNETRIVDWNMKLLASMCFCSALFSMVSLQFYFSNNERLRGRAGIYRNYIDILKDIINSFDIAIVVCSVATFFISSLQLLFLIKIVKQQSPNSDIALQYIQQTSFLRIVAYSFWFASILAFVSVILINCAIDPARSLASKCVAITLGVSAVFLCIWFSCKTLYFWGRLACGHIYRENVYNHLSTLV